MNIHLLVTDVWFYTTLLLTVGYITFMVIAYRFLKPFMHILKVSKLGKRHDVSQPFTHVDPVFEGIIKRSSLREKLHGAKN